VTVAITGASGFVGRRLVKRLAGRGSPVRALVRDPRWRPPPGPVEVAGWTAEDPAPLQGVRSLVHAAAHRPTRYDDPGEAERCLAVNALATLTLLEAASVAGVAHFVYISAGNVYASQDRPAREDDPVWPSHRAPYYLGSKICGEFFVSAEAARGRMLVTTVRPSAIYGPGMPPGLVSTFVSRLGEGQPVKVADGGRYMADLVYVDDVVDGIVSALDRQCAGTFNLGAGALTSAEQLARIVCEAVGRSPDLVTIEPPRGDPPGFVALDIERARRALCYAPRDVAAGIGAMVGEGRSTP
jgi:nucleoside-diphosphate-sugar epimerase